jgi:hypothetical protein
LVHAGPSSGPRSFQPDGASGPAQVYARQGFQGLSISCAQLFAVQRFKRATIWSRRRRDWNGKGDCASGLDEAQSRRKRTESFAWRNERFRIAGRKSLESLPAKSRRFARSFVFNNLTGFSFRHLRARPLPTPKAQLQPIVKRRLGSSSHRRTVLRGRGRLDRGFGPDDPDIIAMFSEMSIFFLYFSAFHGRPMRRHDLRPPVSDKVAGATCP